METRRDMITKKEAFDRGHANKSDLSACCMDFSAHTYFHMFMKDIIIYP